MSFIQKLKFKGKFQEKHLKIKEKFEKQHMINIMNEDEKEIFAKQQERQEQIIESLPVKGKGRILTSGRTVHGKDTFFMEEIQQGDFLLVFNENTLGKEQREVSLVLSDKSLQIKEPFDKDLISYTLFEYQKKPTIIQQDETLEENFKKNIDQLKKGISKKKQTIDVRIKKPGMWGYNTVQEKVDANLSHEQLLDLRSKKSSDRFCWF